ncbi:aminopeptidase P family protein, partial [Candidatus Bathyarchaeota archaeon]
PMPVSSLMFMESKLLALSKRRVEHVKSRLRELGLDAALVMGGGMGNRRMLRLTGSTSGSVLVIPTEGDPGLVVYPIDRTYASDHSWVEIHVVSEEDSRRRDVTPSVEEILGVAGTPPKPCIGVSGALTAAQEEWAKGRMGAEVKEISEGILDPMFSALDPDEWPYQRKISEVVDVGQEAAYGAIRPGVTTNEVAAEIAAAELRAGASGVGYLQVSTGRRSAYSHDSAESVEIRKGDLVLVDLCPSAHGYGSDETRTYIAGRGEARAVRMIEAVNRSVEAVLANIKLGANAGELDAVSRRSLAGDGFPSYPHTLGHTLSGCSRPSLRKGSEHLLEAGSVFTVEPGIYDLGYGGVRIEENVLVTEGGFEVLTKFPRTFI